MCCTPRERLGTRRAAATRRCSTSVSAIGSRRRPPTDTPTHRSRSCASWWRSRGARSTTGSRRTRRCDVHARSPYTRVDVLPELACGPGRDRRRRGRRSDHPTLLFETGLPTRYYFPKTDVRLDLLVPTDASARAPTRAPRRYWSVTIGGTVHPDFAWAYEYPLPESIRVAGLDLLLQRARRPHRRRRSRPRPVSTTAVLLPCPPSLASSTPNPSRRSPRTCRPAAGKGLAAAAPSGLAGDDRRGHAAGIRGRGGAGFPTGGSGARSPPTPRRSSRRPSSSTRPRASPARSRTARSSARNPYRVLEGALIAALAVGADEVVVAHEAHRSTREIARLRRRDRRDRRPRAGRRRARSTWSTGPTEYLLRRGDRAARGRSTAAPVPAHRAAVPARRRRGRRDAGDLTRRQRPVGPRRDGRPGADDRGAADAGRQRRDARERRRRSLGRRRRLVPRARHRRVAGHACVCTVSGAYRAPASARSRWARRLREVIEHARRRRPAPSRDDRGGARAWPTALIPADQLDTPVSYEGMQRDRHRARRRPAFIVFDDETDLVAVAAGVSRFLAVESCGQCTPCKQDGLAITDALARDRGVRRARPTMLDDPSRGSTRWPTARAARSRRSSRSSSAACSRRSARARGARRAHRRRRSSRCRSSRCSTLARRRRDARRRASRASSPTGPSATTGRASRPPTASTTTAPSPKPCNRSPSQRHFLSSEAEKRRQAPRFAIKIAKLEQLLRTR